MDMLLLRGFSFQILMLLLNILGSLLSINLVGVDQPGPISLAKVPKTLRLGSLIPLRNGAKLKILISLFCGHSFGGYITSKYALKHPEHVEHLILVGTAGFTSETEHISEWLSKFRAT